METPPRTPPRVVRRDRLCLTEELELAVKLDAFDEAVHNVALRVITWNVWFEELAFADRMVALVGQVLDQAPQVACLQEVTPALAAALRGFPALLAHYSVSENEIVSYGCLILVHRSVQPCTFAELPLPTHMGRTLVMAALPDGLVVATVHLESLDSERMRHRQLEIIADHLRTRKRAVICGDFNFDATQTFGDWHRASPRYGPKELENTKMRATLMGYDDVWEVVRGPDPGYTFDGETNPRCVRQRAERMRYDRIMVRGLRATAVALLGEEAIDSSGIKPSDHYGLVVDLAATSEAAQGPSSSANRGEGEQPAASAAGDAAQ